jgi:hypothetical protein
MPLSAMSAESRRRFPRLELESGTPLRDLTMGCTLEILDVSFGGCSTVSPVPLEPGTSHRFQANIGQLVSSLARAVHCRGAGDGQSRYVVGWEWSDDTTTRRSIGLLIDHITNVEAYTPRVSS